MSRPVVFLVADKNMSEVFKAFLSREQFNLSLQCGEFDFDETQDLFRHPGHDPGVYTGAHSFLSGYVESHDRAVVVLDAEWDGAPTPEQIKADISEQMAKRWKEFAVIVIDPELENWIWVTQKNADNSIRVHDLVAATFNYNVDQPLKEYLRERDNWCDETEKPKHPKEAVEKVLKLNHTPRSSALYRKIVKDISVKGCKDASFQELVAVLQVWFPLDWAKQ